MKLQKFGKNVFEWLLENEKQGDLVNVIATTFTLNPTILFDLLTRALSCSEKESFRHINEQQLCIMLAENCLEEHPITEKLTVFCDDYILSSSNVLPRKYTNLLNGYYIPNCVCRIAMKNSGSFFHPKLLIAHFEKDGADYMKFAILSKNLTLDSSMQEICAMFESCNTAEGNVSGAELAEFIESFLNSTLVKDEKELCGKSLPRQDAKQRIAKTLHVIRGLVFKVILPGNPSVEASLQFGTPLSNYMSNTLTEDAKAAESFYCCSDSISKNFWDEVLCKKTYTDRYLVSNPRSWVKYGEIATNSEIPEYAYVCQEKLQSTVYVDRKIHAKFAEFLYPDRRVTWLGSGNFTENGFMKNYEADVRFVYPNGPDESHFCRPSAGKPMVLEPSPFVYEYESRIIKLTKDMLEGEKKKVDFEEIIKKIKWSCEFHETGNKKSFRFKGILNAKDVKSSLAILAASEVKQYHLVTGVDTRLTLNEPEKETQIITPFEVFSSEFFYITGSRVPWYEKALLVGMKSANESIEVPIVIDTEELLKNAVTQQVYEKKENVATEWLRGDFSFVDVIPPEQDKALALYGAGDTFDIRLAKYMAGGGSYERLLKRMENIKKVYRTKHTELYENDDIINEDELDEMLDERMVMSQEEKEKLLQRLEELQVFINDLKNRNGK